MLGILKPVLSGHDDALQSLPTKQRLEQMSVTIMRTLSEHDFDSPIFKSYLSPTFRASNINHHVPMATPNVTIETYLEIMRSMKKLHRTYRLEILNTAVQLEEDAGKAVVWVTVRASGLPFDDIGQESVSRIQWSNKGKMGWLCTGHVGIRGGFGLLETSMADDVKVR